MGRTERENKISDWISNNTEDWYKVLGLLGGFTPEEYIRLLTVLRENEFIELIYAMSCLHAQTLSKYLPQTKEDMEDYIKDYCKRNNRDYTEEMQSMIDG